MNVFFERKKIDLLLQKTTFNIFNHFLTNINNWSIWYRERIKEWWQHWSLAARLETYAELHDSRMIGKIHGSGFLNSLLLLWLHMYIEMNQYVESKKSSSFQLPHFIRAQIFCMQHAIRREKPSESKEKSSLKETHAFSYMYRQIKFCMYRMFVLKAWAMSSYAWSLVRVTCIWWPCSVI